LLIRDGMLVEVGPTRRVENLAEARKAREVNAAGRVVMPGFVDSHTHLAFPLPASGEAGTETAARAIRATNGRRLEMRFRGYLQAMARHGTTTVEVKTGCGPDESAETKILRVLCALERDPLEVVPTFLCRMPPSAEGDGFQAKLEWIFRELMPRIRRRRLAQFADIAWEGEPERSASLVRYLAVARELGFACKVHAEQPDSEAAIVAAVSHFAASIDHLEHAGPAEARLLAGSCTMATLLPCASFHSGAGNARARTLINAGVAVALATNFNPSHTPTLSMQTVVALACLRMDMTPAEAIAAATINGAHALGRADRSGSLEPGKLADVLLLDISDYRDMAHRFGANLVHMTMKRGEFIYTEGAVARREDRQRDLPAA
jgi:imidazolonepropionase